MFDLAPIVHAILADYALPPHGTHGVSHWARVLENGLRISQETGANVKVVQLFAVFHDARRINEGVDDDHGRRGADLALNFRGDLFDVSDDEFDLLYAACVGHTNGETVADITIQACWDADRLDLGRVGIRPHPMRLCTDAAKRSEILGWADGRACFMVVPELVVRDWSIYFD